MNIEEMGLIPKEDYKATCDAIREKEQHSGGITPIIEVTTEEGATVTCSDGVTTLTETAPSGTCSFKIPNFGEWILTSGKVTASVMVEEVIVYKAKVKAYLYGFDIKNSEPDPSTRVSYPSDVDNVGFTPAKMNFSSGKFETGTWDLTPGNDFMPRPCMLNYDGTVAYYLDPNDYTKKEDGSPSDIAKASFGGNAMMEWPCIYTKRWESGGVYHFRCSSVKQDSGWDCWCNYDKNNNVIPNFYTPIYTGSNVEGKMRSLSGQANAVDESAQTEVDNTLKNGPDWYIEVLSDYCLLQDLLILIGKSTNSQETFGYGVGSQNSVIRTGTLDNNGLFWGSNAWTSGVKVFGMENFWGNSYRRIAGYIFVNPKMKLKATRGNHDGSMTDDYNFDGENYNTLNEDVDSWSGEGGYINRMATTPYGRFPVGIGGASSTYESDTIGVSRSGTFYACATGHNDHTTENGMFRLDFTSKADRVDSRYGAALSCKPAKKVN